MTRRIYSPIYKFSIAYDRRIRASFFCASYKQQRSDSRLAELGPLEYTDKAYLNERARFLYRYRCTILCFLSVASVSSLSLETALGQEYNITRPAFASEYPRACPDVFPSFYDTVLGIISDHLMKNRHIEHGRAILGRWNL